MSANDGAINEQVFEVWISGAELMQLLEDAGLRPTGKAFIGGIPIAVGFGEQAPLRAAASDPKDGREKAPALPLCANLDVRAGAQEGQNLLPLLIGEGYW